MKRKMVNIKIQKSKQNSDFYKISGGKNKPVQTMSIARAREIAEARARLALKKGRTVRIGGLYK